MALRGGEGKAAGGGGSGMGCYLDDVFFIPDKREGEEGGEEKDESPTESMMTFQDK